MNGQRKKKRTWNRRPYQRRVSLGGNEAGVVLMFVLFAIIVLSVLGTAFLGLAFNEHQLTRSHRDGVQALYLADLGIERAKSELSQRLDADPNKQDFDFELTDNNGYLYGSAAAYDPFMVGVYQAGQYRVLVTNNTDGGGAADDLDLTVWATAEGQVTNLRGHTRTIRVEALLGPLGGPFPAITMDCPPGGGDTLNISGNPTIAGSQGSVHSNCNIAIPGNPNISADLTASDTITIVGSPTVGGTTDSGVPPVPVPGVDPADFKPLADYIFREDQGWGTAKIYDALGNLVFDATGGGTWPGPAKGWKFSGTPGDWGKWEWQGSGAAPALVEGKTFYFEKAAGNPPGKSGNVSIPTEIGTPGNPWQVALVAEGRIDISGNPYFSADTENLLLVAGTDIKLGGNYVQDWPGGIIIAAHEQIDFSGNPEFTGFVLAENAATDDNYVLNTFISGNPTITYDGTPSPPDAWVAVKVLAWRELP